MSRINNTIVVDEYTTILVTKDDDNTYLFKLFVDNEDFSKLGKVHIKRNGYAWSSGKNVSHIIYQHESNMGTVVDHINGNKLDNRKCNLRELTQLENSTNKSNSKNNTGVVGISLRENGNYKYLRATCSDLLNTVTNKGKYKTHGRATKRYTKQFNINKLGEVEAMRQARLWLKEKREEFGYKSSHL